MSDSEKQQVEIRAYRKDASRWIAFGTASDKTTTVHVEAEALTLPAALEGVAVKLGLV